MCPTVHPPSAGSLTARGRPHQLSIHPSFLHHVVPLRLPTSAPHILQRLPIYVLLMSDKVNTGLLTVCAKPHEVVDACVPRETPLHPPALTTRNNLSTQPAAARIHCTRCQWGLQGERQGVGARGYQDGATSVSRQRQSLLGGRYMRPVMQPAQNTFTVATPNVNTANSSRGGREVSN
jgi:hypothetical protein